MKPIRSYSHMATNRKVLELVTVDGLEDKRIVDVGAGEGYFSSLLGEAVRSRLGVDVAQVVSACDLNPELFRYEGIRCQRIDVSGMLPFPDDAFDAACSIEVIEHLEDQFHFVRELHRIVNPGGRVVVTTPNVLNINSRLRSLGCGFGALYNPLPLRTHDAVHIHSGHIHPITCYYLAYIFYQVGFSKVVLHIDRRKRSAFAWLIPFYVPIKLGEWSFRRSFRRKHPEIFSENRHLLGKLNSVDLLTGRTVIIEGIK